MVNAFGIFLFTNISPTNKQYLEEKIPLVVWDYVKCKKACKRIFSKYACTCVSVDWWGRGGGHAVGKRVWIIMRTRKNHWVGKVSICNLDRTWILYAAWTYMKNPCLYGHMIKFVHFNMFCLFPISKSEGNILNVS